MTANTLVFSFIGMKKVEVSIDGRTRIDVAMVAELVGLNEVFVTVMNTLLLDQELLIPVPVLR